MSKGRTTTMVGLRVGDKLLARLDEKCKKLKLSRREVLIPMIRLAVMGGDSFFVQLDRDKTKFTGVHLVRLADQDPDASLEDDEYEEACKLEAHFPGVPGEA